MFEDAEFIAWANENVVFLVGYEGKNHKTPKAKSSEGGEGGEGKDGKGDKEGADGDETKAKPEKKARASGHDCVLYPGISCDEHEKIMEDAKEGKGGPKLEVKGFPTSYMIAPDGTFEPHKADRKVKELEDGVADWTKKKALKPSKKYATYLQAFAEGEKAVDDGKWKAAVTAYLKVDAVGKKMHGLGATLTSRLEALDDAVTTAFEKARDDESADLVKKIATIKALRADVAPKFQMGTLGAVAEMDAWLKANPPPPPPPKAK